MHGSYYSLSRRSDINWSQGHVVLRKKWVLICIVWKSRGCSTRGRHFCVFSFVPLRFAREQDTRGRSLGLSQESIDETINLCMVFDKVHIVEHYNEIDDN